LAPLAGALKALKGPIGAPPSPLAPQGQGCHHLGRGGDWAIMNRGGKYTLPDYAPTLISK